MGDWFSKNKRTVALAAAALGILAAMAAITVWIWPWITSLSQPENQLAFEGWVNSLGLAGWLVMLGLQVLQVVVAVIPGEPVEIIMGLLYGTWGGFFTCEVGVFIGSALVFAAVRALGAPLIRQLFGEDKLRSYAFLQNTSRLELLTFILFFIPGTPKDVLTYVAGITAIRPLRFLLIATVARTPSILSSTWAGSTLASGRIYTSVAIFAVAGLVSLAGILLNKKLMRHIHKKPRGGARRGQTEGGAKP